MCDNIILYVVLNISNKNIVRNLRNLVRNWEIEMLYKLQNMPAPIETELRLGAL